MGDAAVVANGSQQPAQPIAAIQNRRKLLNCCPTDPHSSESRHSKRKQDVACDVGWVGKGSIHSPERCRALLWLQ